MLQDRVKNAFLQATRSALPRIDYQALYRAQVLAQSLDGTTVDVQPDLQTLPPMSGVQLRHGLPGCTVFVGPGAHVLVAWADADPQKPYAMLWEGGERVTKAILSTEQLLLGSAAAADYIVKGSSRYPGEDTMLTTLGVQLSAAGIDPGLNAICPDAAAALKAAGTAVTTFATAAVGANHYLSAVTRTL